MNTSNSILNMFKQYLESDLTRLEKMINLFDIKIKDIVTDNKEIRYHLLISNDKYKICTTEYSKEKHDLLIKYGFITPHGLHACLRYDDLRAFKSFDTSDCKIIEYHDNGIQYNVKYEDTVYNAPKIVDYLRG